MNQKSVYGAIASEHLKHPRNLGKLADAHGVATVEDPDSETLLTIYLKLGEDPDGLRIIAEAGFRAFGCGGCIITGSVATELAIGLPVDEVSTIDGAAINRALDDGLPPEQRYCAELAARALRLAVVDAAR
jgi:NifU-like protein involved in Fe-S cluster formation